MASRPDLEEYLASLRTRITAQPVRQGFDYWCRLKGQALMPKRGDFEPADIPRLLPHVTVVEVADRVEDFQVRLVGSYVSDRMSVHPGLKLGELPSEQGRDAVMARYAKVVGQGRPVLDRYSFQTTDHHDRIAEAVACPFEGSDGTLRYVLSFGADCGVEMRSR